MSFTKTRSRGFTLIELLVVVSIIALLISILLPAVGSARREARITLDAQSMKEHGNGVAIYSASNGDTLPNAPDAPVTPPGQVNPYGQTGRIAYRMAEIGEFPSASGFGFSRPIVSILGAGYQDYEFDNGIFARMSMWDSYWLVMAPFMVEGEGPSVLQDVFYSTADIDGKRDIDRIRTRYNEAGRAGWDVVGEQNNINSNQDAEKGGSFRYVPAAVVDTRVYLTRVGTAQAPWINGVTPIGTDFLQSQQDFFRYARRNNQSDVAFPSQKALFFMWTPFHNPDLSLWAEPSARTPMTMADGSGRVAEVYSEGMHWDHNERSGAYYWITPREGPNEGTQLDAHCFINFGGLAGRDMQAK